MKRKCFFAAAIAGVVMLSSISLAATYSGGDGSSGNPYQIASVTDWQMLMATGTDWGSCFILTADIDLSAVTVTPVGTAETRFSGSFDGRNHIISHPNITIASVNIGLFGYTNTTAVIQNLGVEDVTISASGTAGGLAGINSGTIQACYATGTVSGEFDIGGLVGTNLGSIISCHAAVTVSGTVNTAGGLAGYNPGSISNCYATGAVSGNNYVGGLVGFHDGLLLSNCYATGTVTGTTSIGGLVGYLYTSIAACFWDTDTSATTDGVGNQDPDPSGAAGKTTTDMQTLSTFTLAGWDFSADDGDAADWWMPNNNYPCLSWQPFAGGGTQVDPYEIWTPQQMNAIGANTSLWSKCFKLMADINMSAYTGTQYNIIGNSTTQFTGTFDGNEHIIRNLTYTTVEVVEYVGLFGVILGGTVKDLGLVDASISSGGNTVGGLAGTNYGTITSCYAAGTVSGSDAVGGLVGSNSGDLTSCYATDTVNGSIYVGGLVGQNFGTLTSCYATGTVTGSNVVGGLVGYILSGTLTSCYATGTVTATNSAGGLIGENNYGTITTCYATGNVSGYIAGGLVGTNIRTISSCYATGIVNGTSSAGGLAGYNSGTLTACYTTGTASGSNAVGGVLGRNYGTITACFWDTETSGMTNGVGNQEPDPSGTAGKTTAEMQHFLTFIDAGWDLITGDGDPADWAMSAMSYPHLTWEVYCGDAQHPYPPGDTNYDCKVNLTDFAIVAANWLECTALVCN